MDDIYVLIFFLVLCVNAFLAYLMKNAAVMKGYGEEIHAGAICFFLGIGGCIYILTLPDKIVQSQNQQIIELLKKQQEDN